MKIYRLTNTAYRPSVYEYFETKEEAETRQADFNRSVDDGGLYNLTVFVEEKELAEQAEQLRAAHHEGWEQAKRDAAEIVGMPVTMATELENAHYRNTASPFLLENFMNKVEVNYSKRVRDTILAMEYKGE